MKLLVCRSTDGIIREVGESIYRNHLGILIQPRLGATPRRAIEVGAVWGVDNDAFNGFDRDRFVKMLRNLRQYPGCLFVTAPDVVADAAATLKRFYMWEAAIHYMGFPVAFVAQDGLENLPIPWSKFEAMFIGGSTEWKLGKHANRIALEAVMHGKHVHMGRVNSNKRIAIAQGMGCHTADGTGYASFSKDKLPPATMQLSHKTIPMFSTQELLKCA